MLSHAGLITAAIVTTLGLTLPALAETRVYITKDADGNPVFSDRRTQGSEAHIVRELPSMPAFEAETTTPTAAPAERDQDQFSYTSLTIVAPAAGATLPTGQAGNLEVSGVLSPGLRDSDSLVLVQNGVEVASGRQTAFQLTNMNRGEHELQMLVKNAQGKTIIRSQTVTIFVQRNSSLAR